MSVTLAYVNHGSLEPYDCTGKIGPLFQRAEKDIAWPMYAFDQPSIIVWNAVAANLHKRGWSDKRIREWLASKDARFAIEGSLGYALADLAEKWAGEQV